MTLKSRIVQLTQALGEALDRNEALQAELSNVKKELSTLIDWVMGDADALTVLQKLYLSPDEPAANRIKAAAAAIQFERAKPASASLVMVDFRERVRHARLRADAKLIEHQPESA
jgi:hypothetical protein